MSSTAEKQAFIVGGLVKVVRVGLPPPTPYSTSHTSTLIVSVRTAHLALHTPGMTIILKLRCFLAL